VKVRFYYPQSEKTILNNVVNDYINGTNSTGENPLAYMHDYIRDARWFKTIDGNSLDLPAMTTASQITGAYSLTVVGDNLTTANGVNYVELDDITGFSGGTWGIGTGPKDNVDVLPVELVDLQAYAENDVDVIRWTTASEKNNDYFIVESSSDMTRFREIGKRNGAGNSNTKMMYEFINTDIRNQPQYYRLKQVDFDGSYEYSDIVMTNRTAEHKHFSLYPNPFSDYVYVAMEGMNEMVLVEIYDGLGQIVFMRQIETKDHMGAYKFDLSHLSPGVYMIHLTSESFNKSVKLIRK